MPSASGRKRTYKKIYAGPGKAVAGGGNTVGLQDFMTARSRMRGAGDLNPTKTAARSFWFPLALFIGCFRAQVDRGRKDIDPYMREFFEQAGRLTLDKCASLWGELNVMARVLRGYGHPKQRVVKYLQDAMSDHIDAVWEESPEIAVDMAKYFRVWHKDELISQLRSDAGMSDRGMFIMSRLADGTVAMENDEYGEEDSLNDGGKGGVHGWAHGVARAASEVVHTVGGINMEAPGGFKINVPGRPATKEESKPAPAPEPAQPQLPAVTRSFWEGSGEDPSGGGETLA